VKELLKRKQKKRPKAPFIVLDSSEKGERSTVLRREDSTDKSVERGGGGEGN